MDEDFDLWLRKARESLKDAEVSLVGHRYGLTAFCCQQALEKILKAAIVKNKNERPRKVHDLLPLAKESGLEVTEGNLTEMAKISKFYFIVHYPDLNRKFFATPKVANETLDKTKEVFKWIESKLKKS
jgi:HEPN domain-containing protein